MNCLESKGGVDIGVQPVDINCEEMGMDGDDHGPDGIYEMICVFYVAWVFCGDGAEKVIYVLGDVVGGAVAV